MLQFAQGAFWQKHPLVSNCLSLQYFCLILACQGQWIAQLVQGLRSVQFVFLGKRYLYQNIVLMVNFSISIQLNYNSKIKIEYFFKISELTIISTKISPILNYLRRTSLLSSCGLPMAIDWWVKRLFSFVSSILTALSFFMLLSFKKDICSLGSLYSCMVDDFSGSVNTSFAYSGKLDSFAWDIDIFYNNKIISS